MGKLKSPPVKLSRSRIYLDVSTRIQRRYTSADLTHDQPTPPRDELEVLRNSYSGSLV